MRNARRWMVGGALLTVLVIASACTAAAPASGDPAPTVTVKLEGGAQYVNHLAVTVSVVVSTNAKQIRLANGADTSAAVWQPIASAIPWTLAAGADGQRIVTVDVQTASGRTASAFATITLDTTPPVISIDDATNGQTIDVSHGEAFALTGPVSDDRSGVAGVQMTVEGQKDDATIDGGRWARPAAAPDTAPHQFVATATDVAGNTASVGVTLTFLLPPEGEDIVQRPTAVVLTDADMGSVIAPVDPTGARLRMTGDQRARFAGKTAVAGPPNASIAPRGVLRTISGVTYDAASDVTTLTTGFADATDIYARYRSAAVQQNIQAAPAVRMPSAQSSDDDYCGEPWADRTIHVETPPISVSTTATSPGVKIGGSTTATLSATASIEDLRFAFMLDVEVGLDLSFGGASLQDGSHIESGAVICGTAKVAASATITSGTDIHNTTTVFDLPEKDICGNKLEDVVDQINDIEIPVWGPITLGPNLDVKCPADISVSGDAEVHADFVGGFQGGIYQEHGDLTTHGDLIGNADLDAGTSVSLEASIKLEAGLGIQESEVLKEAFITASLGPVVKATASILPTTVDLSACLEADVKIGFKLSVHIPFFDDVTIFKVEVADLGPWDPVCAKYHYGTGTPLDITTINLPDGVEGTAYSATLQANEPDVRWSAPNGDLPGGLSLDPRTGKLSGTPTSAFTQTFDIQATDLAGRSATQTYLIYLTPTHSLAVTSTSLPDGAVGSAYSAALSANYPATWSITSGALPDGLVLDPSTGVISGVPTAGGPALFNVQATDPSGRQAVGPVSILVATPPPPPVPLTGVKDVSEDPVSGLDGCAVLEDGHVDCWGFQYGSDFSFLSQPLATPVPGISTAVDVEMRNADSACVLLSDGTVTCWTFGETAPTPVPGLVGVKAIGQGWVTCAIGTDTTVHCIPPDSGQPAVSVPGLSHVVQVSSTYSESCAVIDDGSVRCWANPPGGLPFVFGTPWTVPGLDHVMQVSTDSDGGHTDDPYSSACALRADGSAACWTDLHSGQSYSPEAPSALDLPAGVVHLSSAVTENGDTSPVCGRLGAGTVTCGARDEDFNNFWQPIAGLADVTSFSGHGGQYCAVRSDATVWCAGVNSYGQLGDGTTNDSAVPVQVKRPG
jgi:Putative Ig domain